MNTPQPEPLCIFILDDADFNEEQGTESQVWMVFIGDDFMNGSSEGFEQYDRKCYSQETAFDYADTLAKKFPSFDYVGMV